MIVDSLKNRTTYLERGRAVENKKIEEHFSLIHTRKGTHPKSSKVPKKGYKHHPKMIATKKRGREQEPLANNHRAPLCCRI